MSKDYMTLLAEPYELTVTIFRSKKKLKKFLKARGYRPEVDGYAATVLVDNLVYMHLPKNAGEHAIWHEMLHAAWYVLDIAGVKVDVGNHEALTYLQSYLVGEYHENILH